MNPALVDDTLKAVLTSRVYDVAIESPLRKASKLSAVTGRQIYLKREDLQPVHSFKLRGAYNRIVQLSPAERHRGVITASAGNHAQGVALAAQKLGISALIIMPRTTPAIKVEAVQSYGAEVELVGDSYSDAATTAEQCVEETGRVYIHPFDDPLVIAGQGTIGREIIEQLSGTTHIFVPVGGGGLIAGIATYVKAIRPDVQIISVEPCDSNAMQASVRAGERLTLPHVGIFADGVAVKQVGRLAYQTALRLVDDFITVSTDQICTAIKQTFEETRSIVEPAGALGVAGIMHYALPPDAVAVAICSGANMTFERLQQIAERTLIGSGKEAMFAVTLPERPGALHDFYTRVVQHHNISEFDYRFNRRSQAHILVGIGVSGAPDKQQFVQKMHNASYQYTDLSDDELAKEHIRHMVGGPASEASHEQLYEVNFPERPGALGDFLGAIGDRWNISLFHYRSAASDSGSVLIGFETADRSQLEQSLTKAGFEFTRANDVASIRTFIA